MDPKHLFITKFRKLAVPSTVLIGILCLAGCGNRALTENQVASSEVALDQAREEFRADHFPECLALLDKAIKAGGLRADLYGDAVLMRARCHVESGSIEAAQADLAIAEQGAGATDQIHLVRGLIFRKQGDEIKAKQEIAKAKSINAKIVIK